MRDEVFSSAAGSLTQIMANRDRDEVGQVQLELDPMVAEMPPTRLACQGRMKLIRACLCPATSIRLYPLVRVATSYWPMIMMCTVTVSRYAQPMARGDRDTGTSLIAPAPVPDNDCGADDGRPRLAIPVFKKEREASRGTERLTVLGGRTWDGYGMAEDDEGPLLHPDT